MTRNLNEDVSVRGMLRTYADGFGFTIRDGAGELEDNALVIEDVNEVKSWLEPATDSAPAKYIISHDGVGLTLDELAAAQKMMCRKNTANIPGKFGVGYSVTRSLFSQNRGKCVWLTCHKNVPDNLPDEYMYGHQDHFASCVIDMDKTMEPNSSGLCKTFERGIMLPEYKDLWEEYSIDKRKPGVVLVIPVAEDQFKKLNDFINTDKLTESLKYDFAFAYRDFINSGIKIYINDCEIPLLPDIRDIITSEECQTNYELRPYLNPGTPLTYLQGKPRITYVPELISKFIIRDVDSDKYYVAHKSRQRSKQPIEPEQIETLQPIPDMGIIQVRTTYITDANWTQVIDVYKPILEGMGINISQLKTPEEKSYLVRNFIKRAKKNVVLQDAMRGHSGDYIWHKIAASQITKYSMPATERMDSESGVEINKNNRLRKHLHPELDLCMHITYKISEKKFKLIAAAAATAATAATTAATAATTAATAATAAATLLCYHCNNGNGIVCPCGICESQLICDSCDATSIGFWRCGSERENEGVGVQNDDEDEGDDEDENGDTLDDDEDSDDGALDEEDDEEDEEDDDGENDAEQVGGTHGVAGYDAHNGLEKQRCLNCLNSLCGIGEGSHDECIQGINQDSGVRIEGLKSIYNDTIGQTFCPQDRMDEWKDYTNVLKLDFVQYINGIKHFINTTTNNRIRGGAKLDKLVQYFNDN